ncbi:hypothetical protein C1645_830990 [Glomus cerebriforme]|uniref:Uncharacterized protein n=1 Tax=Glomus cerebriforme TaxID=658196 RepID=A0A397SH08_9GLOM|nr:hypothetical protein C1645_830990 [Glomus cerebriforme]
MRGTGLAVVLAWRFQEMYEEVTSNFPSGFVLYLRRLMGFLGLGRLTVYLTFQKIGSLVMLYVIAGRCWLGFGFELESQEIGIEIFLADDVVRNHNLDVIGSPVATVRLVFQRSKFVDEVISAMKRSIRGQSITVVTVEKYCDVFVNDVAMSVSTGTKQISCWWKVRSITRGRTRKASNGEVSTLDRNSSIVV